MSISLNDVLSVMRTKTVPHVVGISLTIHGQVDTELAQAPYIHYVYVGYGCALYIPAEPKVGRVHSSEHLSTEQVLNEYFSNALVKVLHNGSYSGDKGTWGEYQSFLVQGPAAKVWGIRIDPPQPVLVPFGSPPLQSPIQLTLTLPERPDRIPWSVDLTDDNAFVRGVGPDPYFPNERALYCLAFGAIVPYKAGIN